MKNQNSTLSDVKNFINLNKGSLCYFSSDDLFFIDEALNLAKNKKNDKSSDEFNYNIFYGHERGIDKILETVKTFPFMAKNRLGYCQTGSPTQGI